MLPDAPDWTHDIAHDGGETGCGMLVLELKRCFDAQPPNRRVLVRALDSGAPMDLPAWCRLTGHRLIEERHPYYLMETRSTEREKSNGR